MDMAHAYVRHARAQHGFPWGVAAALLAFSVYPAGARSSLDASDVTFSVDEAECARQGGLILQQSNGGMCVANGMWHKSDEGQFFKFADIDASCRQLNRLGIYELEFNHYGIPTAYYCLIGRLKSAAQASSPVGPSTPSPAVPDPVEPPAVAPQAPPAVETEKRNTWAPSITKIYRMPESVAPSAQQNTATDQRPPQAGASGLDRTSSRGGPSPLVLAAAGAGLLGLIGGTALMPANGVTGVKLGLSGLASATAGGIVSAGLARRTAPPPTHVADTDDVDQQASGEPGYLARPENAAAATAIGFGAIGVGAAAVVIGAPVFVGASAAAGVALAVGGVASIFVGKHVLDATANKLMQPLDALGGMVASMFR
ncbi:hypothetical protein [Methylobacterium radiotolerans]|uniref:hypothetical protein n=1 Tax=Methylobacterium radiotolerans TaxID=31998 RepID=UPI0038D09DA9